MYYDKHSANNQHIEMDLASSWLTLRVAVVTVIPSSVVYVPKGTECVIDILATDRAGQQIVEMATWLC